MQMRPSSCRVATVASESFGPNIAKILLAMSFCDLPAKNFLLVGTGTGAHWTVCPARAPVPSPSPSPFTSRPSGQAGVFFTF